MKIRTGDGNIILNSEWFAMFRRTGEQIDAVPDPRDEDYNLTIPVVVAPTEELAKKYMDMIADHKGEETLDFYKINDGYLHDLGLDDNDHIIDEQGRKIIER